jgi:hypothetical protein
MDYLFLSSLSHSAFSRIAISYDISCQWSVNLEERMERFPPEMVHGILFDEIDPYNAKFHDHGHKHNCDRKFSLNYRPHVARTDGESAERRWACFNQIASQAKELGPGGRHDLIDVVADGSNWSMAEGFGMLR